MTGKTTLRLIGAATLVSAIAMFTTQLGTAGTQGSQRTDCKRGHKATLGDKPPRQEPNGQKKIFEPTATDSVGTDVVHVGSSNNCAADTMHVVYDNSTAGGARISFDVKNTGDCKLLVVQIAQDPKAPKDEEFSPMNPYSPWAAGHVIVVGETTHVGKVSTRKAIDLKAKTYLLVTCDAAGQTGKCNYTISDVK